MEISILTKPSLTLRIGIGKTVGFLFGLVAFIVLPYFAPDTSLMFRWGYLLWYTTLGAIIGIFGVFSSHPLLDLPFPWWVRAPLVGAWMNFVLIFFTYDQFGTMMAAFGLAGLLASPFWFVLEGAIVGLIIGWLATRFGGEGPESVGR